MAESCVGLIFTTVCRHLPGGSEKATQNRSEVS